MPYKKTNLFPGILPVLLQKPYKLIGSNLYSNKGCFLMKICTCASLVKFFGTFNHVKHFVSLRIARQLYFAFIYSRIRHGIEAYGSCAKEIISKLIIMQNKVFRASGTDVPQLTLCMIGSQYWKSMMFTMQKFSHMWTNVQLVRLHVFLLSTLEHGKQDSI